MREDCEEGSASDSIQVLPRGNTFTDPPNAHRGLTGEVQAGLQEQLLERHALERRDVAWWGGEVRWELGKGRPIRTAKKVQVLPWGNTFTDPPRARGLTGEL